MTEESAAAAALLSNSDRNSHDEGGAKLHSFLTRVIFCLALGALCAPNVHAQDNSGIIQGEWKLKCNADSRCELGNTLQFNGTTMGRLLIYRVGKKTVIEYLVPLRINLHKGAVILVDRKISFPTMALYCDAPGCVGFANLDTALLSAMQGGKQIELAFTLVNEEKQYAFPFTLIGFTKAYSEYTSRNGG